MMLPHWNIIEPTLFAWLGVRSRKFVASRVVARRYERGSMILLQLTFDGWDTAFAGDGVLTGDARPGPADGLRIARLLHEDPDGLPVEFVQSTK
jgi:hypothetical protein